jgi:hypothetical protein
MILFFITFYCFFSILVGLGILRYEQEINNGGVDILGMFIYPITWPYFLGIAISKIVVNSFILTYRPIVKDDSIENDELTD